MLRLPFAKRKRNSDEACMVTCQVVNFTVVRLVNNRAGEGIHKTGEQKFNEDGSYCWMMQSDL
jgi:hypothetical protein